MADLSLQTLWANHVLKGQLLKHRLFYYLFMYFILINNTRDCILSTHLMLVRWKQQRLHRSTEIRHRKKRTWSRRLESTGIISNIKKLKMIRQKNNKSLRVQQNCPFFVNCVLNNLQSKETIKFTEALLLLFYYYCYPSIVSQLLATPPVSAGCLPLHTIGQRVRDTFHTSLQVACHFFTGIF